MRHACRSLWAGRATHQALEDIALMRVQPNMTVIYPCDAEEARKATYAAAFHKGPVYLRFAREKTPVFTTKETPFEIGKANILWESEKPDVTIIGTGPLLYNALTAAHELEAEGVKTLVLNLHTIKPLDADTLLSAAQRAGAVVTVEEHQIAGGMGSAVAEFLAQNHPVPMEFVGVRDAFGQSRTGRTHRHYGMGVTAIGGGG